MSSYIAVQAKQLQNKQLLKNIPTFDILTKKTISIMEINFLAVLVAALSSFVVGFVWYNPKVFGTIWMNEVGMTEEKAKQGNMAKSSD